MMECDVCLVGMWRLIIYACFVGYNIHRTIVYIINYNIA
jgi:hypothetical protein